VIRGDGICATEKSNSGNIPNSIFGKALDAQQHILYIVEYMTFASTGTLGEFEQLILLGLFRLGENAYGATIHGEVQKRTGRDVSISAVYTTLDRLEEKGMISSRIGEPTKIRGGRRKKYYRLEPQGAEALARSYREFRGMVAGLERRLEKL
jgi:DNA-binding PadR family transcriptional regulator